MYMAVIELQYFTDKVTVITNSRHNLQRSYSDYKTPDNNYSSLTKSLQ